LEIINNMTKETKEKKCEIPGGAVLWARQTINSEIFIDKPDKWFKIWFYIVNKVKFKDEGIYERGEYFFKYDWISEATGATRSQIKHCIEWLKCALMIATRKTTRGMIIKVLMYDHFQTLDNYYLEFGSHTERNTKGTQKEHRSHTILKNDKNDKNGDIYRDSANPSSPHLDDEKKEKINFDIHELCDVYWGAINSRSQLTTGARHKLKVRLRTYTKEDLITAIGNFSKDDWWMKNNSHRGMAWFFHTDDRIEQFINLCPQQENGEQKKSDSEKWWDSF